MATMTVLETSEPRFELESDSYYRRKTFLQATTTQCHASNLCLLKNGDLLCAWFGGSQEGKPDISIYLARLNSGLDDWGEAQRMTFDETRSEQNPVLFEAPNSCLWLLYTSQNAGDQDSAIVKYIQSTDGGKSWSKPNILFNDPGTFIRQPMVILEDDIWVLPIFKCRAEPGYRWIGNDDISCVRASKDQGLSWTEYDVPNSFGCVHMEMQRLRDGSYLGLFRSRWADHIYLSTSPDGLHWNEPTPTSLPNPNAGICFDVMPSGRVVLIYNHSSKLDAVGKRQGLYDEIAPDDDRRVNQASKYTGKEAFWGAPRAPLCLAWSDDNAQTWKHKILEDGDGYCMTNNSEKKLNRELSYPSMVKGNGGTLHIAFTHWRQQIKYLQVDEKTFCT